MRRQKFKESRVLIGLMLLAQLAQTQEICIKNNPLLDFLFKDTNTISAIDNYDTEGKFKILRPEDKHIVNNTPILIKTKTSLYILIEGTGRVYEAKRSTKENICFERIDSTYFAGYNGNAIKFEHNDTLFSFGGEGFWKENGQLRYFSKLNHEWNIEKINKELPAQSVLYHLKENNTKLYYLQIPKTDQATGNFTEKYIITRLDLIERKNVELGELHPNIAALYPDPYKKARIVNVPSLNGSLVGYNADNIFLFDFEKNQVYKMVVPKIKDAFFGNSQGRMPIHIFETGGNIYYCFSKDSTYQLYSLTVSKKDFELEPYPLYTSLNPLRKNSWLIISGAGLVLLIGFSLIYRKRQKINSKKITSELVLDEGAPTHIKFNPNELELILKMAGIGSKGMTVEDINTALGLSRRTIEIQKKIRTETINKINHKFKIIFNTSDELIERIRMEDDRRYYTYKINNENKKIILSSYKNSK